MSANLSFNPALTTTAAGSFNTSADGVIQGTAYPDPATRFALRGGILDAAETLPMWGGVGISEDIAGITVNGPAGVLGSSIKRALLLTGATALTGFSVFDQAYGMVNSPQSPVQLAGSGGQVMYYRLGSGARIAVACDPALISLYGAIITSQVSWDFVNQRLVPYAPAYNAVTITGAVWASTSGGQTTFTVSTDLSAVLVAGDDINVIGVVSTGGTGVGYNGAFTVVSVTSTTIVVTQAAAASPGTYSSGGTVVAGGGALAVKIDKIFPTGNMTVVYDPLTGFATWNRNGAAAIIQL